VPLSAAAQSEARFLMLSANNLLKPQDGKPVTVPTQDMVLGCYYLTVDKDNDLGEGRVFSNSDEAIMAYDNGYISLHAKIKVRMKQVIDGVEKSKIIETTAGKLIFNEAIPQNLGFVDRNDPDTALDLEVNFLVSKKELGEIIERCINVNGANVAAVVLDKIKTLGFKYSTKGAVTIGISDMIIPEVKQKYLDETDKKVEMITKQYRRGLITNDERKNAVITAWSKTTEDVKNALIESMDKFNPVYMMSKSGARGNINQIRQLAGMRGLMSNTSGETIEMPIRSNFREGLNVLEYFISTHGARKGLADTALRTADSGYLTRRLVDVSQDVIVREDDCGTDDGIVVSDITTSGEKIEGLEERLTGRYAAEDIINPQTGEVIAKHNQLLDSNLANKIVAAGLKKVKIRSVLTCDSRSGVCSKCYGISLATGGECNVGEAVGIIAAQSIGEPGTQLTMRTFHTGGVAGDDITQGLPRVEELFEARKPKGLAIISDIAGTVTMKETKKKREVVVSNESGEAHTYLIPYGSRLKVSDGEVVEAGDELTEGSVNPHDILKIKGIYAVQSYLLHEVQKVYRLQGVDINDKHVEVIVRQMMKRVKVEEAGDTELLPGSLVDMFTFNDANERAIEAGLRPAEGSRTLLGITKASLATDSFLSAASFQETTRVLTEAAIKGRIDPLLGLKENVILGKLIPAGTGMNIYRDLDVEVGTPQIEGEEEEIKLEIL